MCGGDGTAMCGEPRVAAECTCTEREFGRCSRPTVRPGRNVNDERDHGDGSDTRQRGRRTMTTGRHRLNRGGHRHANAALYRAVIVRMRFHQPTRDDVARRTAAGRTKREIIRCLKRFLAREIYQRVMTDFRTRQAVTQAASHRRAVV